MSNQNSPNNQRMGMSLSLKQVPTIEQCDLSSCGYCNVEHKDGAACAFEEHHYLMSEKNLTERREEAIRQMKERRDNPKKTLADHLKKSVISEERRQEILSTL